MKEDKEREKKCGSKEEKRKMQEKNLLLFSRGI